MRSHTRQNEKEKTTHRQKKKRKKDGAQNAGNNRNTFVINIERLIYFGRALSNVPRAAWRSYTLRDIGRTISIT